MAVSLTPKSGKTALGVVEMKGNTNIDNVAKLVTIAESADYRHVFSFTR